MKHDFQGTASNKASLVELKQKSTIFPALRCEGHCPDLVICLVNLVIEEENLLAASRLMVDSYQFKEQGSS